MTYTCILYCYIIYVYYTHKMFSPIFKCLSGKGEGLARDENVVFLWLECILKNRHVESTISAVEEVIGGPRKAFEFVNVWFLYVQISWIVDSTSIFKSCKIVLQLPTCGNMNASYIAASISLTVITAGLWQEMNVTSDNATSAGRDQESFSTALIKNLIVMLLGISINSINASLIYTFCKNQVWCSINVLRTKLLHYFWCWWLFCIELEDLSTTSCSCYSRLD